ncbi:hypothetical protein BSZ32_00230 [Rubritalea profundi]|uniref:Uncharacterized protein n=1 Tax=Rubritalea profundi TaxID=1658618 RepID=A0A2S7TYE3_9BACT|nr:hypothetical protein BSZ32_00230 [Rubritalea profundi]
MPKELEPVTRFRTRRRLTSGSFDLEADASSLEFEFKEFKEFKLTMLNFEQVEPSVLSSFYQLDP